MKHLRAIFSLLLLLLFIYFSFYSLMPTAGTAENTPTGSFSTQRALTLLKKISAAPHYHGSAEHGRVRQVLLDELQKLGLETQTQQGFVLNPRNKKMDRPINVMGHLKGTGNGKALLLMSHYDSAMVPSLGAADAGSGIVTILEGLRAYKASGKKPVNDIIVLFTDAEEIGLDGAKSFVKEHPWAAHVGLALNFEARGSGGPSSMILETNGGNAKLINAFIKAKPKYPVASSLMYSIYKLLPNDTDSTVFREAGDIDSFFFAFIDDHFDYHTANDTVENLDVETLHHQGTYLMPLLDYFAKTDLNNLKDTKDYVYVNVPLLKMISYPFTWVLPMLVLAVVLFIVLLVYAVFAGRLAAKAVAAGFLWLLSSLLASGLLGYYGWLLLVKLYPHYNEIQHGFKYNGHSYVAFFVLLTLGTGFMLLKRFNKKHPPVGFMVGPITIWLIINTAVFIHLKGAAYFIIPTYFALVSFFILLLKKRSPVVVLTLLGAPAVFFFAPLVQFFPVGLGSDHVFISCIFTILLFGLLLPVLYNVKYKSLLAVACFVAAVVFFIDAHAKSGFSETRQKPNSLIYYKNADDQKAHWVTYDEILDDWTRTYLGETPENASNYVTNALGGKYGKDYTYAAAAPLKNIENFTCTLLHDSVNNTMRTVSFTVKPRKNANMIELFAAPSVTFSSLSFNGQVVPNDSTGKPFGGRKDTNLLRYILNRGDSLQVSFLTKIKDDIQFKVLEYSFDLTTHPQFNIKPRPKATMPKPFVVTDAIIVEKSFNLSEMKRAATDSVTPGRTVPRYPAFSDN